MLVEKSCDDDLLNCKNNNNYWLKLRVSKFKYKRIG